MSLIERNHLVQGRLIAVILGTNLPMTPVSSAAW